MKTHAGMFHPGQKILPFTAAAVACGLLLFAGTVAAQVLTINNGSTLTINGGTLNVNCQEILVKTGGTFDLAAGALMNRKKMTVETGGNFTNTGGSIDGCNVFYPIRSANGTTFVITLPQSD